MLGVLVAAIFALILGLVACFFGYRVFLVLLPIWGFFAGFWIGAEAVSLIIGTGFLATVTGWVVGFISGLILALLSYFVYILGVALVSAAFGAALGVGIMGALGFDGGLLVGIVAIVCGIALAVVVLAFNVQKYVIMFITALGGANAILLAPLLLFGVVSLEQLSAAGNSIRPMLGHSWLWLIAWLVIAAFGIVVQVRTNRSFEFTYKELQTNWG